jgi:hypothetical protein
MEFVLHNILLIKPETLTIETSAQVTQNENRRLRTMSTLRKYVRLQTTTVATQTPQSLNLKRYLLIIFIISFHFFLSKRRVLKVIFFIFLHMSQIFNFSLRIIFFSINVKIKLNKKAANNWLHRHRL